MEICVHIYVCTSQWRPEEGVGPLELNTAPYCFSQVLKLVNYKLNPLNSEPNIFFSFELFLWNILLQWLNK